MKVLYISHRDRSEALKGFANAFTEKGHKFFFTHFEEFRKRDILTIYNEIKPDIVIVHHNKMFLRQEVYAAMNKSFIIFWMNDERIPFQKWMVNILSYINLYLCASDDSVSIARSYNCNSEYLIMGFTPMDSPQEKKLDILFLGSNYNTMFPLSNIRRGICLKLKRDFGNRFHLHGRGWGDNIAYKGSMLTGHAKIGLSINAFNTSRCYSNRMLNIMKNKSLCVSHIGNNLNKIFTENENIVFFRSYGELVEKLKYYLNNDKERERIALNGYNFVMNNLTWYHKGIEILEFIKKYKR